MRSRTNGAGIAAGTVAMVASLSSFIGGAPKGRPSEGLPQLAVFTLAALGVAYLLRRRRARAMPTDFGGNIKVKAVMLLSMFMVLSLGLIAFPLVEAIGRHAYGWLALIPLALWTLRVQIITMGRVLRIDPAQAPDLLRSKDDAT